MKKITSVFYALLVCSIAISGYASANGHPPGKSNSCIVISDNELSGPQIADVPAVAVLEQVNKPGISGYPLPDEYLADTIELAVIPGSGSPVTNSKILHAEVDISYHLRC